MSQRLRHRMPFGAETRGATIERLSELADLITSYRDAWGNMRRMTEGTQHALLAAMGINAENFDAVAELPLLKGRKLDGEAFEQRALEISIPIGPGYHRLRVFGSGVGGLGGDNEGISLPVIVVPNRCYVPRRRRDQRRAWAIGIQLYGLRSARNWGIGDFTDLGRFLGIAARLRADAVSLNPLHALFPGNPERISPYSPSDRRFLSMLYIDVEAIADFAECEPAKDLLGGADLHLRLDAARKTALVDYSEVAAFKRHALGLVFRSFRERHLGGKSPGAVSERGAAFRRFPLTGGEMLDRIGIFQALSDQFGPDNAWWDWPELYRDCESAEVAKFATDHRDQIEFFQYLQWQANQQLGIATQAARDAGMAIGLYHDLALAADSAGAESWMNRRLIAKNISLGAPPDEWNHRGHDWGLPAYNPLALRAAAYAPFAATVRANMNHGAALRVDHVIGPERMYWIPRGADPQDGGYVRAPAADLIGVLALESSRQKCLVIGEDLGTLPEGFQERMRAAGILSYRLLFFAQDAHGDFVAAQRYPSSALVAIGTHDLATFPGFWRGRDLDMRTELGLYPSRETEALARERRTRECRSLIKAFKREGLLPVSFLNDTTEFSFDLIQAAYRFLARSPATLLLLHLEDALGEENQINMPGTVAEYPNWRRKMLIDVEELERDPRIGALSGAIRDERRARRRIRRGPQADGG